MISSEFPFGGDYYGEVLEWRLGMCDSRNLACPTQLPPEIIRRPEHGFLLPTSDSGYPPKAGLCPVCYNTAYE